MSDTPLDQGHGAELSDYTPLRRTPDGDFKRAAENIREQFAAQGVDLGPGEILLYGDGENWVFQIDR